MGKLMDAVSGRYRSYLAVKSSETEGETVHAHSVSQPVYFLSQAELLCSHLQIFRLPTLSSWSEELWRRDDTFVSDVTPQQFDWFCHSLTNNRCGPAKFFPADIQLNIFGDDFG